MASLWWSVNDEWPFKWSCGSHTGWKPSSSRYSLCKSQIRPSIKIVYVSKWSRRWFFEFCLGFGSLYLTLTAENAHLPLKVLQKNLIPMNLLIVFIFYAQLHGLWELSLSQQCWIITRHYILRCWVHSENGKWTGKAWQSSGTCNEDDRV